MPEKPSQLRDRQDAIDKIRLTHDIAEQKRIEIENNSELGEEEKQQELEIINRETEVIVADIKRQAKELSKDDTFLNWVRKKFSKGVLVIAVLKTMAGISASAEIETVQEKAVATDVQHGESEGQGYSDIYQDGGSLGDDRDSGVIDVDRDYSQHYEASETQSEITSADIEHVNELINNFCEQRGLSPWEVGVKIHLSSSSSIDGDANLNADLSGQNLQIAQESLQNSLGDIGVNADNLQVTGENLGEASIVDGKVLNEAQAMEAMCHDLGLDEAGVNKIIHAYNHGEKISAEQGKTMDKYLGDSRGIKMIVELEDLSERNGFTPHVSDGFTPHESNTKIIYTLLDQDPAILNREAIPEDRQQNTEEIYDPNSSKSEDDKNIFRTNNNSEILKIDSKNDTKEDDRTKVKLRFSGLRRKKEKFKLDSSEGLATSGSELGGVGVESVILSPESLESTEPTAESVEPSPYLPPLEPQPEPELQPQIDPEPQIDHELQPEPQPETLPTDSEGIVENQTIKGNFQMSPDIQATRRQGSEGEWKKSGKDKFILDESGDAVSLNRVKNKGVRSRLVGEERKFDRKTKTRIGQINRKKTREFVRGKKEEGLESPVLDDENYN